MARFVRFSSKQTDEPAFGKIDGNEILRLSRAPWDGAEVIDDGVPVEDVTLRAPVVPSKVICIGLNYHAHVTASQSADKAPDYPLIFLKPPSAVIGPGEDIIHPAESDRVDYEAELGVVIGETARNVPKEDADEYILGLTCVNDVTARDLQKKDGQWSRAKGFDTFCPVGPWIVSDLEYRDLLVEGVLNGKVMQSGRTSQMIFDIPFLVSYISGIMTLYPGDLISTGTPAGIAPMKPGDEIEVKVEQVGTLKNRVVKHV